MERKKWNTLIELSNRNFTTRINPINRHGEYGFSIRRANKLNRSPKRTSTFYPIMITDQE